MFEIKSKEDIELLKEISECFAPKTSNSDLSNILEKINEFENSFILQSKSVLELTKEIKNIDKEVKKLAKETDRLLNEINKIEIPSTEVIEKSTSVEKGDLFTPYIGAQKIYDKISLDGIRLIHTSWNNQKYALPLNIFELISILEAYKIGMPGISIDKVNELCKEFGVTKMQFSKIYYNLLEDKFNDILHEVDKMITTSLFSVEKGFIYRNDVNTNISVSEFKEMYNEYIESSTPFFTIYKIIKESADYNAFDIFVVLRKKDVLLRILGTQDMD